MTLSHMLCIMMRKNFYNRRDGNNSDQYQGVKIFFFSWFKQTKLRSYRTAPKYKYVYQVYHNFGKFMKLDRRHRSTICSDATNTEMVQLGKYDNFKYFGKDSSELVGYKKIWFHIVYYVNNYGCHKSRLVTDGHLTDIPVEKVYSGVFSLRSIRLLVFLAEINIGKA